MNKKDKHFFVGLLVFVIIILCITVMSFILKDNDNYVAFIGNILVAVISAVITFVVLFITIKQGNENQETALNLQSALQVENNLLHLFEKQKEVITESANKLDDLLFTVQILKLSCVEEISEERKNLIDIFSDYRKAMNTIKLNTDIYVDTSKCDGCTDCDIKSYGEVSKRKTKLYECFNRVELNCNFMVQELQVALDECIDVKNLLAQNNLYKQQSFIYEEQIKNYKERVVLNPNDNLLIEKLKQFEEEYTKLQEKIKEIDAQNQTAINDIAERNKKARNEANKIQICDRNELYNAMMKYFDAYSFYINENKQYIMKNGRFFDKKCKKYMLD